MFLCEKSCKILLKTNSIKIDYYCNFNRKLTIVQITLCSA